MANIHYKLARMLPDKQIQYMNSCIDHSQRAILSDASAGVGYFYKGLCLGRLGELKGMWNSLKTIKPFRENMEAAVKINPAIDNGGPHRALGRLYFKLPGILGGSLKKSIDHLRKAVDYGPRYWENHFFLAESYFANSQYRLARSELHSAMEIASQTNDDPDSKTHTVEFQTLMKQIEHNLH
jgi:tetratricopeptide (TPR) repeat protein